MMNVEAASAGARWPRLPSNYSRVQNTKFDDTLPVVDEWLQELNKSFRPPRKYAVVLEQNRFSLWIMWRRHLVLRWPVKRCAKRSAWQACRHEDIIEPQQHIRQQGIVDTALSIVV